MLIFNLNRGGSKDKGKNVKNSRDLTFSDFKQRAAKGKHDRETNIKKKTKNFVSNDWFKQIF